jgi:hypothetical protein
MAENTRGLHTGALGSAHIPTAERLEDYDSKVFHVLPGGGDKGTLFALSTQKFGKLQVDASEFSWWDKEPITAAGTITTAATPISGATLQLASVTEADKFPIGSKVYNQTRHEYARVTNNDGTAILAITKPMVSGGTDTQWEIADKVINLGITPIEGGGPVSMVSSSPTERRNFVEYLERTVRITDREMLERTQKTGLEYEQLKQQVMIDLMGDIELTMVIGAKGRVFGATSDQYQYSTDGIVAQIPAARKFTSSNTPLYGGTGTSIAATTYKNLISKAEDIFQYSSREQYWFTHPAAMTSLIRMVATDSQLQLEVLPSPEIFGAKGKDAFGFNLRRLVMGAYSAVLVPMPYWKEKGLLNNMVVGVDPQYVKLAHLGPGVLRYETDILQDGSTKKVDRWSTYMGVKLMNPKAHTLFNVPTVA